MHKKKYVLPQKNAQKLSHVTPPKKKHQTKNTSQQAKRTTLLWNLYKINSHFSCFFVLYFVVTVATSRQNSGPKISLSDASANTSDYDGSKLGSPKALQAVAYIKAGVYLIFQPGVSLSHHFEPLSGVFFCTWRGTFSVCHRFFCSKSSLLAWLKKNKVRDPPCLAFQHHRGKRLTIMTYCTAVLDIHIRLWELCQCLHVPLCWSCWDHMIFVFMYLFQHVIWSGKKHWLNISLVFFSVLLRLIKKFCVCLWWKSEVIRNTQTTDPNRQSPRWAWELNKTLCFVSPSSRWHCQNFQKILLPYLSYWGKGGSSDHFWFVDQSINDLISPFGPPWAACPAGSGRIWGRFNGGFCRGGDDGGVDDNDDDYCWFFDDYIMLTRRFCVFESLLAWI